jgi:aminopeptidase YwaD
MRRLALCLLTVTIISGSAIAQNLRALKHEISTLCGPAMHGRGYIAKGHEHAAKHIMRKMRDAGLQPVMPDSGWFQYYYFPVNIFPDTLSIAFGKKALVPGADFLVDPASRSYHGSKQKVKSIDLGTVADEAAWKSVRNKFNGKQILLLRGADSLCRMLGIRLHQLPEQLPVGAYIIPKHGKMIWSVSTEQMTATVLYVQDTALPKKLKKASIDVHAELMPENKNRNANVMGMVRGTAVPDSFIVISAHYDHLGRMGEEALFPGASDNASGTATLLELAAQIAAKPERYSVLFIAFSGEEAGLLGSEYYTSHPVIPLQKMRFLLNLDIMGNAKDGVTVVNATEYPDAFRKLQAINADKKYLPEIRSRGKARNSDHYHFSEKGVPAFFMYSNGGPGYYHDIFDTPGSLELTNIDKVIALIQGFVHGLN